MSTISTEVDQQSVDSYQPPKSLDLTSTGSAKTEPSPNQTDSNKEESNIGEYFERRARVPPTEFNCKDDKKSKNNGSAKGVHFALDNPSFVYERDLGDDNPSIDGERHLTVDYKDPDLDGPSDQDKEKAEVNFSKKSSRRRCLWIVVAILLILVVVMTSLFIWRMLCCKNEDTKLLFNIATPTAALSPVGCKYKPRPIEFGTLPSSIQKELDNLTIFLKQEIKQKRAVAVSANIVYRDKVIWHGGFGTLNTTQQPARVPTVNTLYAGASVSKVFTALMLFKLKNDKRVKSLDDYVDLYEDKFSVRNPFDKNKITLRQLASQQSGLPREGPCYPATSTNLCPYDYNTMLNRLKNVSLVHKPGALPPRYSNLGFAVLGQILAKKFQIRSGSSFNQWMKDELFSKIGMSDSSFFVNKNQKVDIPVGYLDMTSSSSSYPVVDWGWVQPAGGLFTSVHDLAEFQIELMSDKASGRILSDVFVEEFFRPNYIFPSGKTMTGTPWEIQLSKGYLLREKSGYIYGYNSYVVMVPEIRLGLNLLCTGCQQMMVSVQSRFKRILSVFNDELTRASVKNFSLPPDPKSFIGRYNSSIPVLKTMEVHQNSTSHMTLAINDVDIFFLNYTAPLTFRIIINPVVDCYKAYILGVQNDEIIFDEPANPGGLSRGFTMHDAAPDGRSYFPRI